MERKQLFFWQQAVSRLRRGANAKELFAELKACSNWVINHPAAVKVYHDTLLYLAAYPVNEKVHDLAVQELNRLSRLLQDHQHNQRWQYSLSGSGLPFTEIRCQYSAALVQWLLQRFPGRVIPAEAGASSEIIQQISQASLPGIEFHQTTQGKWNTWNRIKLLSGHYKNAAALQWLLQLLEQQYPNPLLRDQLYDRLKIFVSWKLADTRFSRSFLRCPVASVYYRKKVKKKINSDSIIKVPVGEPRTLTTQQKEELVDITRVSLALYYRETDPVTFADLKETHLFDMGDGLQIVLTGMSPERKLSLESYIGFMAFSNGIPVAYGGGWIFGYSCKIGINIYPPFRGGGSDLLFCQVLRLYYQRYKVKRFVVKPYQFGKGNPEGLKSGAFWFYYKLGFRPANPVIRKMAAEEWKKILHNKSYRTPVSLLKSFTACNKIWKPVQGHMTHYDADTISMAVTRMIRERFAGDRGEATVSCMKEMSTSLGFKKLPRLDAMEKKVWQNWSLLFAGLPGTGEWTAAQRRQFIRLLKCKASGSEMDYILFLQQHKAFWSSVKEMLRYSA